MSPFEILVAASGAEPDTVRRGPHSTLVGRCPICDHAKSFLVSITDDTASAWCVMNHGLCTPEAILDRCGIDHSVIVATFGDGGFELLHELPANDGPIVLGVQVLDRDALATLPAPEPLVGETIDRRTVALLAGPPGRGKSFVALAWAASVATGTPWLGRPVEKGRVLYVVGEGAYGVHSRLAAWEEHSGVKIPADALLVLPTAVQVSRPANLDALVAFVESGSFDLVIVDTLARMSVGVDENSAQGMGVLVDAFERVKRATADGSVLLVHHTGKDGDTVRGSSSLEGAMDTVYKIDAAFEPHVLRRSKRKDGPVEDEIPFRLEDVAGSCVFVSADPFATVGREPENPEAWHPGWHAVRLAYFGETTFTKSEAVRAMVSHNIARSNAYRYFSALLAVEVVRNIGTEKNPSYKVDDLKARRLRLPIPNPFSLRGGADLLTVVKPPAPAFPLID